MNLSFESNSRNSFSNKFCVFSLHKIERNFLSELTRPTDFATFSCNAFIDVITVLSEVNNTLLNDTLLKNAVLLANGNIAFSIKLAFLSEVDALLFKLDKVLSNDGVNTLLDDGLFNNNSRSLSAELPEDADEALEDAGVLSEIAIDTALSDDDDEALEDAGVLSEFDGNELPEDAGIAGKEPLKNIVTLSGVANTLFTDVITLGTVDLFSNT